MSGDYSIPCPLCGKTTGVEDGYGNYTLKSLTWEEQFACAECGYAYHTQIRKHNGKLFWHESYKFPMDENGKVLRPQPQPEVADGESRTTECLGSHTTILNLTQAAAATRSQDVNGSKALGGPTKVSKKSERKKANYEAKKNLPPPLAPTIPHFTVESVLPMLRALNPTKPEDMLPLTYFAGYIRYSDENDGTAYLVSNFKDKKPLVSFSVVITDQHRKAKCGNPDCKNNNCWDELLPGCTHDKDYFHAPVTLHASLCRNEICTEPHIWVMAKCIDCEGYFEAFQLRQIYRNNNPF